MPIGYNTVERYRHMTSNRFDFLELGDDGKRPDASAPQTALTPEDAHPHLGGSGVDAEGRPLAQVTVTDTRGYYDILLQAQRIAGEPAISLALQPDVPGGFCLTETIGRRGVQSGEFNFPTGLAVDAEGVLFVADSYNHRVQRITPDGGVAVIGSRGAGYGQFLSPQDVDVDIRGAFYVLEQGNNRIQKFSSSGVQSLAFGRTGHLPGEFFGPTGIAVARSGLIYVADTGNSRVQQFSASGEFLGMIGSLPGARRLTSPQSIALDEFDNVYIADTFTHRVLRFDPMGRFTGELGGLLQTPDGSVPRLVEPRAVAVDTAGLIYIAERGDVLADGNPSVGRLQVIDRGGFQVLSRIDRLPQRHGLLNRPSGIAIGPASSVPRNCAPRGDVYVADTMNHRILRFGWQWK